MAMPITGTGVGAAVRRKEDPRLITGSGTYTDDLRLPGTLYTAMVRSPHAHARILSVNGRDAQAAPGVVGVYTFADLRDLWQAPLPCAWAAYPKLRNPAHWPLANGEVRHVGEAVAVVVARSRAAAEDGAQLVHVAYEPLPAAVDLEQALQPGAPKVHADLTDNVSFLFDHESPDVDEQFRQADRVIRHRLYQQRLVPHAMEPRAVVADYKRVTGQLTLYSSTQVPHFLKIFTSALTGISEQNVRVVAPEVGGGFGSKLQVYPEELTAVALSMRLGRPVAWTMARSEEALATHHGREGYVDIEAAVKNDGTLLATKFDWVADMGAYNMLNGPYVPILGFLVLPGPYRATSISVHITGVFTNKMGTDAYRGAGRPEATYFLERTMDAIARELGLDPVMVRRTNLIRPEDFPFTTSVGLTYDSGNYQGALDKALQHLDYQALRTEQARRRSQPGAKLLGIGVCTYIEACGLAPSKATAGSAYGAALYESAEVRVHHTGKITVFTGSSPHGQGLETAFAQIVCERLGVNLGDVDIVHGDTDRGPLGTNTYGSRSLVVGGIALYHALEKVREKAKLIAAHRLECNPDDLEFATGKLVVKGSPQRSIAFADIAAAANLGAHSNYPEGLEPGLEATHFFFPENFSFPGGTHLCVVEVDPETGKIEILRYVAVDDAGVILNPLLAEGQVQGGIAQGIAAALFEELRYDSNGQPLMATLMDYAVPTAVDLPDFETAFAVTPAKTNPLGVRGIGEAGTIASTAAVAGAVCDAVGHLGIGNINMPMTPPNVWAAITAAKGGQ